MGRGHAVAERTSVLLSSIFFMADSVVRGNLMIAHASSFSVGGLLRKGPGEAHSQRTAPDATLT